MDGPRKHLAASGVRGGGWGGCRDGSLDVTVARSITEPRQHWKCPWLSATLSVAMNCEKRIRARRSEAFESGQASWLDASQAHSGIRARSDELVLMVVTDPAAGERGLRDLRHVCGATESPMATPRKPRQILYAQRIFQLHVLNTDWTASYP